MNGTDLEKIVKLTKETEGARGKVFRNYKIYKRMHQSMTEMRKTSHDLLFDGDKKRELYLDTIEDTIRRIEKMMSEMKHVLDKT